MNWKDILICGVALSLLALATIPAQEPAKELPAASPALRNAVILIIRHAEKPQSGPELSPAGVQRSLAYTNYFRSYSLGSAPLKLGYLFATADSAQSRRPRLTLEPLSKALGLKIDSRFASKNVSQLADEIRAADHGRNILICWHHGQIPELLRTLGAAPEKFLPHGEWPGDTFDWVIELRYDQEGRLLVDKSRRVKEHLMPGDAKQKAQTDAPELLTP